MGSTDEKDRLLLLRIDCGAVVLPLAEGDDGDDIDASPAFPRARASSLTLQYSRAASVTCPPLLVGGLFKFVFTLWLVSIML